MLWFTHLDILLTIVAPLGQELHPVHLCIPNSWHLNTPEELTVQCFAELQGNVALPGNFLSQGSLPLLPKTGSGHPWGSGTGCEHFPDHCSEMPQVRKRSHGGKCSQNCLPASLNQVLLGSKQYLKKRIQSLKFVVSEGSICIGGPSLFVPCPHITPP